MPLKIVHISDTHLREFNPEPGDILIHSGDALNYGDLPELPKFRQQLLAIHKNYKHIIFVPGNHDRCFEWDLPYCKEFLQESIPNIVVLHNEIWQHPDYALKFYGTADQPEFCNWAFNRTSEQLIQSLAAIPEDTDILITHCPPKGILDYVINAWNPNGVRVGCSELNPYLAKLKNLKLHAFGHIHYGRGLEKISDTWYSNASMVDERYQPGHKENIIELDNL